MSADSEMLAKVLAPELVLLENGGKITAPYKVTLSGADGKVLAMFEIRSDAELTMAGEDINLAGAALPLRVKVTDSKGVSEWDYVPPALE
jgi:hypothetical protein